MSRFSCFWSWRKARAEEEEAEAAKRRSSGQNTPGLGSRTSATQETNPGKIFRLQELAAATQNFSVESFIGQGGFGPVYKGKLEGPDQVVAIKKLDTSGVQGNREFCVEVLMLSLLRHPNLVNMIGYCAEGDQRLLVYEYLPLGSLETHLHDLSPNDAALDWNTRMMIAAEAAKGLNYLHHEANPPVIYRDLKASNILLGDGFHAKLSDFGLAKFGPSGNHSHVSTRVMGTYGYCAPEYASSGKLTMKSDIYSFGVVLLELITGRKAVDETRGREKYLVEWARPLMRDRRRIPRMADPRLQGHFSPTTLRMAVELAAMCIREEPISRPNSNDVMLGLEYLASRKYEPQKTVNTGGTQKGEGEDSTKETSSTREQAVAEAREWGERERRRHSAQGTSDDEVKGSDN